MGEIAPSLCIASENYRRDSNHLRLLVVTTRKKKKLVLLKSVFVSLRFESRDWCVLMELWKGLRDLDMFAEH